MADKSPIFPSLSDGKLLHWRLMTSCRAILRVCSLFASFHRCCRCYGMRFLRGRVEVVDSLATTTRMVISRHVQSGNFTPSLFNKCVVINSRTCPPRQQRAVGAFSRPFSPSLRSLDPWRRRAPKNGMCQTL